jgi:hypothetical protein
VVAGVVVGSTSIDGTVYTQLYHDLVIT